MAQQRDLKNVELIFLGTGGARFSMITQKRHTGGIRFIEPIQMQIDPGPGSIVYSIMNGLNPSKIQALLVSHCHTDHYTDTEAFIEAMTEGGTRKRGVLLASKSVISGNENFDRPVSRYHKSLPRRVVELTHGDRDRVESMEVVATSARHSDPDTVGFRFNFPGCDVGYISDTEYFVELPAQFQGVRVLIMSVLRPRGSSWKGHLSTQDAMTLAQQVRPDMCILTHFGMKMIYANPTKEAKAVEDETGIRTVAATDNMRVKIGKEIMIHR